MRSSLYFLGAAVAYVSAQQSPEISAAPGSLPIGAPCSSDEQCANGAQCYGVSSFTIRTCGSFQAACTSDSQCATNTCNEGFCNGPLSSSVEAPDASPTIYIPSQSSVIAEPSSLPLGAPCSSTEQCANGAQCYAVAAWTITTCGSFQSSCTSDDQCATNACNDGFCNGPIKSSVIEQPSVTGTGTPSQSTPTFPPVTAEPGTLPLGAPCSSTEQCANGAQCYAVTAWTITTCGSFQSACTSDNQCATNTCNQGFCNGLLPSGSSMITVTYATGTVPAGGSGTITQTAAPTGGSGTSTQTAVSTYTGAAFKASAGPGFALLAGFVALAL